MHKTKNTQKRLKNGLFALGGVVFLGAVIYALGVLNDVSSAPGSFGLKVENTVPNRVEYLESLEIKSAEARQSPAVTLSHEGHYLKIDGPVNIDSLAVGDERNSAGEASAVFGGTNNQAQGTASAIVGGSDNSLNDDSSNSVLAATAGVNVDRGQQIFIGAANNSSATQSQNVMIVGGENSNVANTQNALIAGDGHTVTASSAVVFGKNVNVQDKDNIFVYSNKGGVFSPAQGNAFYINAQSGVALNHTEAAVQLDINGGLVLQNKEQSSLPTLDSAAKGTMTVVTKNGKIGLCGRDGKQWMPLSESAKAGLCVANGTLPQKPINDGSNDLQSARTHGAASNRSTVTINNSITSLPKVWDDVHGVWKDQVWTYHTDLGAGQYICGVGYHTNMDKPNGVFTQNCMACTYIDNMYSWTSDGKGVNNCGFTCKAGFKYSASARSCTACEPGTYIAQNGHTQTQCTLCDRSTHKKPDHSYYTTENSCAWKCDDGYAQVGNTCQKAEWKKEEGNPECKPNGLLNEGEKTIRRVCKTSRGVVVDDESICNHWSRTKPNPISRTERVYKQGCNDTWNCPSPDCSARGECGGKKKNVECTALAINQNGTEYTARKQELVSCDRPCENAQCGSQHSSYFDGVLTERSSNLCLLPSVLISRSLGSTSTGRWTWQCQGKDTDASCHAQQRAPGAPSCPSEASLTSPSCDNGSTVINHRQDAASHTWQCQKTEGRLTKTSGSCLLCKSGYHREANVCVSNSKELDCVKTGKPEHAKYIDAKVTVTWNKQTKEWSKPAACAWQCNEGYEKKGSMCIKKQHSCIGFEPENASIVPGDSDDLTVDTQIRLVEENSLAKCEYICNKGYNKIHGRCVLKKGASCGSAHSGGFSYKPYSNLCSYGTPTEVVLSGGSWVWQCQIPDESSSLCSAIKICPLGYGKNSLGQCVQWQCQKPSLVVVGASISDDMLYRCQDDTNTSLPHSACSSFPSPKCANWDCQIQEPLKKCLSKNTLGSCQCQIDTTSWPPRGNIGKVWNAKFDTLDQLYVALLRGSYRKPPVYWENKYINPCRANLSISGIKCFTFDIISPICSQQFDESACKAISSCEWRAPLASDSALLGRYECKWGSHLVNPRNCEGPDKSDQFCSGPTATISDLDPKCEGVIPLNASAWSDELPLVNKEWKFSDTFGGACTYRCNQGYQWENSKCIPISTSIVSPQCASELRYADYSASSLSLPYINNGIRPEFFYIGGSKEASYLYAQTWCKEGTYDPQEFKAIYDQLAQYKLDHFTYHCALEGQPSVQCQVQLKPGENLYFAQHAPGEDRGFKIEKCSDGEVLEDGACKKVAISESCEYGIQIDDDLYLSEPDRVLYLPFEGVSHMKVAWCLPNRKSWFLSLGSGMFPKTENLVDYGIVGAPLAASLYYPALATDYTFLTVEAYDGEHERLIGHIPLKGWDSSLNPTNDIVGFTVYQCGKNDYYGGILTPCVSCDNMSLPGYAIPAKNGKCYQCPPGHKDIGTSCVPVP